MSQPHALIVGATGLIGSELLHLLIRGRYYQKISVLSRREIETSSKRVETIITTYSELSNNTIPEGVTDVYCCLGTTMKKAGSKEAFKEVDYEYPLKLAKIAKKKGAKKYLLISAMGANAKSPIFYNQVKGEVERDVAQLQYSALHIFRPSLLVGDRDEERTGEKIGQIIMGSISPILVGGLRKYRPIEGEDVASAMYRMAKKDLTGQYIFESDKIQVLADYENSEV